MRGWTIGTVAALLLLLPSAGAEPLRGHLLVEGASTFENAEADAALLALVAPTSSVDALAFLAPEMTIHYYESRHVGSPGQLAVQVSSFERSWTAGAARVSAFGPSEHGFVGVYPGFDARADVAADRLIVEAAQRSTVALERWTGDADSLPTYQVQVNEPHHLGRAIGTFVVEGASAVKVLGLEVTIESAANRTTFKTGIESSGMEIVYRWLVLDAGQGSLRIMTREDARFALGDEAALAWDGSAWLNVVEGELGPAPLDPGPTEIRGNWRATSGVGGGAQLALADVSGEPAAQAAKASVVGGASAFWWLLGAAALVGGAGTLVARRTRAKPAGRDRIARSLKAHHEAEARKAADQGRWDAALDHVRAVRLVDPGDAAAALEEATYLWNTGRSDEALACYREAAMLAGEREGEPAYWAAIRFAQAGDIGQAEGLLLLALEREPELVIEVIQEPLFEPLRHGVSYAALVADAHRRLRRTASHA